MSVINQMLRDLEQRKVKDTVSEHYIDEINIVAKRPFNPRWFSLTVLLVLISGMILYHLFVNKNNLNQTHDKQQLNNTEIQPSSALINLPGTLAEIKPKDNHVIDSPAAARHIETPAEAQPLLNKKTAGPLTVKENIDTKKMHQQPSVKMITSLKPEAGAKLNTETKIIESSAEISKETKGFPEAVAVVKVPVKSSVKSGSNQLTAEQLVYQARQLMVSDQTAAIALLEENLQQVSADADYYSLLANLQQRRQQYDNAIVYYRKALEIAPQKGELWIGIALAYRGTGEEQNAVEAFKQALITEELNSELREYAIQQIDSY